MYDLQRAKEKAAEYVMKINIGSSTRVLLIEQIRLMIAGGFVEGYREAYKEVEEDKHGT